MVWFYGYRVEWYKKSVSIRFEGRMFRGILEFGKYLTFKFSDYMELPQYEDRKVYLVSAVKV